jgi:16S rRNA (guanine1516-N2)-methyltransferase
MGRNRIAVLGNQSEPRAQQLADALNLPLVAADAVGGESNESPRIDMVLAFAGSRLEARMAEAKPLWVDFLGAAMDRRRQGNRRTHPLARAVGRKQPLPRIVDATAGLGRDAYVLASLGYEVVAVERCAILHAMLANGLARAAAEIGGGSGASKRLRLVARDGRDYLRNLPREQLPDVVYMDPMFPSRGKAALVKKELQFLQRLLGAEADAESLFEVAMSVATRRVVVKRPVKAPPLAAGPNYQVRGGRVRWDVYLVPRAVS